jgi:hypothetical protein
MVSNQLLLESSLSWRMRLPDQAELQGMTGRLYLFSVSLIYVTPINFPTMHCCSVQSGGEKTDDMPVLYVSHGGKPT